jgi:hypothetical protein
VTSRGRKKVDASELERLKCVLQQEEDLAERTQVLRKLTGEDEISNILGRIQEVREKSKSVNEIISSKTRYAKSPLIATSTQWS